MAQTEEQSPPRTIRVDGANSPTLSFELPQGAALDVESVYAEIDAGGAADTIATVSVLDPSGVVIASKAQTRPIPAGGSGSATWALRLDDEPAAAANPFLPIRAVLARQLVNQTPAPNVLTTIIFTQVPYDLGGWIDLLIDPTLFTVPETGFYVVEAGIRWDVAAAGGTRRSVWLNLNGSLVTGNEYPNTAGTLTDMNVSLSRRLVAGDVLRLNVLHAAAAPLVVALSHFSATRVWKA